MFLIKITVRGAVPGVTKREWGRITKEAYHAMGAYWHKHFRAKHFTRRGAIEYGYKPRKGETGNPHVKGFWRSYTGRKQRLHGHTRPLEWTGESKTRTMMRDIRSIRSRVRVVLHANKLNFRNPHSRICMYREMTAVSGTETWKLIAVADRIIQRRLDAIRGGETKTVR